MIGHQRADVGGHDLPGRGRPARLARARNRAKLAASMAAPATPAPARARSRTGTPASKTRTGRLPNWRLPALSSRSRRRPRVGPRPAGSPGSGASVAHGGRLKTSQTDFGRFGRFSRSTPFPFEVLRHGDQSDQSPGSKMRPAASKRSWASRSRLGSFRNWEPVPADWTHIQAIGQASGCNPRASVPALRRPAPSRSIPGDYHAVVRRRPRRG